MNGDGIMILLWGGLGSAWAFLVKHLINSNIHPNKNEIVYKDVLDEIVKRLDEKADERHNELKDLINEYHRKTK